jgi:hypothetical protein
LQKAVLDHVMVAPIFQQGFLCAVGPRVAEAGAGLVPRLSVLRATGGLEAQVKGLADGSGQR